MEVLLDEIDDSWPDEVRSEYLDQRTSLGFTAYMIACARGHEGIAELLEKKGCDASLVNTYGENGAPSSASSPSCTTSAAVSPAESNRGGEVCGRSAPCQAGA